MSNYDDALSLIENEVNRDCEYYVYSQLRDCIDTIEDDCKLLESDNAKLRELVLNLLRVIPADVTGVVIGANTDHPTYYKFDEAFHELRIEVDA